MSGTKPKKGEDGAKPRLLLLDGDVFCFIAAAAAAKDIKDPDEDIVIKWAHPSDGERILDNLVATTVERLKGDKYLFIMSDPKDNWRKHILPSYKSNRKDTERPQLLEHLKEYVRGKYDAMERAGMEADDLLGIIATMKSGTVPLKGKRLKPTEFERVIVTKDKDLKSVPCVFANLSRVMDTPNYQPEPISVQMADFWHMVQAFAGDKVDGYDGCPGIGMERASTILRSPVVLVPDNGFITRGKNKGQRTVKWMPRRTTDLWDCILSHYQKAGLSEEEALVQARVARICRADDYDIKNNQVKLWTPTKSRAVETPPGTT